MLVSRSGDVRESGAVYVRTDGRGQRLMWTRFSHDQRPEGVQAIDALGPAARTSWEVVSSNSAKLATNMAASLAACSS